MGGVDFPDVAFGALFPFLESVADLDNGMTVVAAGAGGLRGPSPRWRARPAPSSAPFRLAGHQGSVATIANSVRAGYRTLGRSAICVERGMSPAKPAKKEEQRASRQR